MAKNLSPEDKKLLRENKALSDSIANGGKTSTGAADPLTHKAPELKKAEDKAPE
jgi:hypothetical protein